jgi:hypothetical protein
MHIISHIGIGPGPSTDTRRVDDPAERPEPRRPPLDQVSSDPTLIVLEVTTRTRTSYGSTL